MDIRKDKRLKKCVKIVLFLFVITILYQIVVYWVEESMDWDNRKYILGESRYTQEEVLEYFEDNKDALNKTAQFVLDRCTYYDSGELNIGISICRSVKYYNRHNYSTERIQYFADEPHNSKMLKKYKNDYFSKDEIKLLNQLTDHYCNSISLEPLYYYGDNAKSISYLRFIFMSSTFSRQQELVYMPDGSDYTDAIGEIMDLGDGWYYNYTAY